MRAVANIFKGGAHPPDSKAMAAASPLHRIPLPATLTISMSQHLGAPAVPCVAVGDHVAKYQPIARQKGLISADIHAPATGVVKEILPSAPTPSGRSAPAIVIATEDGGDEQPLTPLPDWSQLVHDDLVGRIREAGVVGMGGAGFPTAVKLFPPIDKPIDTIIVNGAECEPYLCADSRLMAEHADEIAEGCAIMRKILSAKTIRVAIEENKPEAIRAMEKAFAALDGDVAMLPLRTLYPQGAEKMQIFAATGRTVPMGGLPMDVGCVVENAGTVFAIREAVVRGIPLVERTTTVAGGAAASGANLVAPIGTPFADLVAAAGGTRGEVAKVICGGPMMGFAIPSLEITTTKTSSGLLLFAPDEVECFSSTPCINCSRCVAACPLRLQPNMMSRAVEADDIDLAERTGVMDCFECGACAYVCPARRPLVQHFRRAKAIIVARRRAAAAAGR